MMDFSLKIDCSNAAFSDRYGATDNVEIAKILHSLADGLLRPGRAGQTPRTIPGDEGRLYDSNNNKVGAWIYQ